MNDTREKLIQDILKAFDHLDNVYMGLMNNTEDENSRGHRLYCNAEESLLQLLRYVEDVKFLED
jgi:hypothetical protein